MPGDREHIIMICPSRNFLISCINPETTGSKGRGCYFPVPVNGRIVISLYYGDMAGRFCEYDHRVAVSNPDVIPHADPVK